jgi:4'-phosphopantetheinyl transferase
MRTGQVAADRGLDVQVDVLPLNPGLLARSRAEAHVLSAGEDQRLGRLRRAVDRDAYLVAHLHLRLRLGARLGVPAAAVRFGRRPCPRCGRPTGRPRTDPFGGVEFSVSHTDGLVAIALARVPVGVDVQRHPDRIRPALLRGLHPAEADGLLAGPSDRLPGRVATCWVRKEAVLKGEGLGIGHGISWPLVGGDEAPTAVPGWRLTDLATPDGYAGALAVLAAPPGAVA